MAVCKKSILGVKIKLESGSALRYSAGMVNQIALKVVRSDGRNETILLDVDSSIAEGAMNCITGSNIDHFFLPDGTYDGWGKSLKGWGKSLKGNQSLEQAH
jgi:hypothetical protein